MISFLDIHQRNFQKVLQSVLTDAQRVLDIGCGIGDYLCQTRSSVSVVGVDPHLPYVEKARERAPWATVHNTDGISFLGGTSEQFDCILMIDVLEHLQPSDAIALVEAAKKHCNGIILSQIPIGLHEQHHDDWNMGGEEWQTHRSTWEESTVERLGFDRVFVWKDYYTWDEHIVHKSRDTSVALWTAEKFPLVSVVVPSYNQADWLPATLDSIITQTYPFWEAVVVNDGSTDSTKEVIESYEQRDKRIRGVHKVNGGISSALNTGIDHAHGKYFCWLSSDDLFTPDKLAQQIDQFDHCGTNTAIVFGAFDHVDPKGAITTLEHQIPFIEGLEFPQFLKYDYIDGCTIMIPMKIMRDMGGFNVQFKHAQDTELWFRFAARGYSFKYLPQKLTCRRIHPSQGFTDFGMDCRFDGFWMVDYYLSHYSFRDFYRNVDFSSDEGKTIFFKQFFDMLVDPNCNINYPMLSKKFWEWFTAGMKSLSIEDRGRIIQHGKRFFTEHKLRGKFFEDYLKRFNELDRSIGKIKPTAPMLSDRFHDISLFDTSKDVSFAKRVYEFGMDHRSSNSNVMATSAFKYLADRPNAYFDEAFRHFYTLTFVQGNYEAYARSFKRKPDISHLPEKIIAAYAFSKIFLRHPADEVERVIAMLSSPILRENVLNCLKGNISPLSNASILQWNFTVVDYSIKHMVTVQCPKCIGHFSAGLVNELSPGPSRSFVVCSHCSTAYSLSDEQMVPYFLEKNSAIVPHRRKKDNSPDIGIVMRYSNIIGGGVKKIFEHAEWLEQLGCKVTVYSDAPAPAWRSVPGKFVRVKDHYDVPAQLHDAVVCMCIYDVAKMLTKYPADAVALFCQGYEGYHLGRTYDELRSDKYFYTALHSLPSRKIVVSKHLVQLFEEKFSHKSLYIPNGMNHTVYYPDLSITKTPKSLLFIGNPNDPLKGLVFLTKTLEELQRSEFAINGLQLHVAFGGSGKKEVREIAMPGYVVHYHEGLSGKEVAALVNSVELVINTSWYEGFSLPVLEAMSCGTPVVTTNNMGAESFCSDSKNSFVVNYGDMNRLGNVIIDVVNHSHDLSEQIFHGLATAIEYSEQRSKECFATSYAEFLGVVFPEQKVKKFIGVQSTTEKMKYLRQASLRSEPEFTILVPTYNQAQFLPASLQSLIDQTEPDWEAIVVNDGSTDDTQQVLERYAFFDKRIKVYHKENGGVATALNEALKHAHGKWICWLSSDDLFEPNKLETHKKYFEKTPDAQFYYTLYQGLNHRTGKKVKLDRNIASFMPTHEDQVISFFFTNYINGISICAHRSVFETTGGFNPLFRNGQDFDMWLRISEKYPLQFLEQTTCTYRVHAEQGATTFPEAGEYDSCLACVEFLNTHPFERLFPWSDLGDSNALLKAFKQTIAVATDSKSFINRLGFGSLLIDRLHEWISVRCKVKHRAGALHAVRTVLAELKAASTGDQLPHSLQSLEHAGTDNFSYRPIDTFVAAKKKILEKIDTVGKDEAAALRKYLERIEATITTQDPFVKHAQAILFLLEKKQFTDVLQITTELERETKHPFDEGMLIMRGCAYIGLKNLRNAKSSFEAALELNPKSSEACSGLAEVFYLAEMDRESKAMYEWAVVNNGENITARKGLAKINKALHLRSAHNSLLDPHVDGLIGQAEDKINCGEIEHARSILAEVLHADAYHLDALNDLAVCHIIENDIQKAVEIIALILSIDPDNEIAVENIALLQPQAQAAVDA